MSRWIIKIGYLKSILKPNKKNLDLRNSVLIISYRSFSDFLKTFMRLISNPVFMPQTLATCILLFTVSGMMSFKPKYLETQFFIPAWKANMLLGRYSRTSMAQTLMARIPCLTRTRSWVPNFCTNCFVLIFIFSNLVTGSH